MDQKKGRRVGRKVRRRKGKKEERKGGPKGLSMDWESGGSGFRTGQ